METIGTILAFVFVGAMAAFPFVLFALLWREAGRRLEREERRRSGPRHAW